MKMKAKKKLTNAEKRRNAEIKKELQKEGIIPPDKQKLNREKFIKETEQEYNAYVVEGNLSIYRMYRCLMMAVAYMQIHKDRKGRVDLEAVGASKVMKIALQISKFYDKLEKEGQHEYKIGDLYEVVKDVLEM